MTRPMRIILCVAVLVVCAASTFATPALVETHEPFMEVITNTCTGDMVTITGFLHSKLHTDTSSSGNVVGSLEANVQSAQGTAVSGARYVETESTTFHQNFDGSDVMPLNSTLEIVFHLTRLGEDGTLITGDDLVARTRAHMTINANGTTTVDRFDLTGDCR